MVPGTRPRSVALLSVRAVRVDASFHVHESAAAVDERADADVPNCASPPPDGERHWTNITVGSLLRAKWTFVMLGALDASDSSPTAQRTERARDMVVSAELRREELDSAAEGRAVDCD